VLGGWSPIGDGRGLETASALAHVKGDSSAVSFVSYDHIAVVAWLLAMKVSFVGSIRFNGEVGMKALVNIGLGMLAVLWGLKR